MMDSILANIQNPPPHNQKHKTPHPKIYDPKKDHSVEGRIKFLMNLVNTFGAQVNHLEDLQNHSQECLKDLYYEVKNNIKINAVQVQLILEEFKFNPSYQQQKSLFEEIRDDFQIMVNKFDDIEGREAQMKLKFKKGILEAPYLENYFADPDGNMAVELGEPDELELPLEEVEKKEQLSEQILQLSGLKEIDNSDLEEEELKVSEDISRCAHMLRDLAFEIGKIVYEDGKKLDDVYQEVNTTNQNVQAGNKEIMTSVKKYGYIKFPQVKLGAILAGVGAVVGTVVPGPGNIIGAGLGGAIGFAIGQGIREKEKKMIREMEGP